MFIIVLLVISACGTSSTENQQSESGSKATTTSGTTDKTEVSLVRIVNGYTVKVNYNGQEETVRYLLIDTPETKHRTNVYSHTGRTLPSEMKNS